MRQKFEQNLPKCAIFLYKNTTKHKHNSISEFGYNSSTLTISDFFVAHSCFQPIDPKNGLKLFFCCVCCITFVHSSHYFLFKLSRVLVPVPTKIFQLVAGYFLEKRKLPVQTKALLFVASIFLVIFLFPCDTL